MVNNTYLTDQCPICGRELGNVDLVQFHHLIPRTFKGRDGISVHAICHKKIHATIEERSLLKYYHTVDRLLEHEEIQKFVKWISKKPIDYVDKVEETNHRYNKRRKK